ncbi:hypothetical protein DFH07DRAFT_216951 [Mycena maculata]|uniref:Uncharacterized protein n=1 Tax=Mycena maculata TaxID=230809 RepID=A0AAD7NRF9_9AGAR|nr:hypothetical protein DFH07DRAFT_216951 [Mycena maculata]
MPPGSATSTLPPSPPPTPPQLERRKHQPGHLPSHPVVMFDAPMQPPSTLSTKARLGKACIAPNLPHVAAPTSPPGPTVIGVDDIMDVNVDGPALVRDDTTAAPDPTEELDPMLASTHHDEVEGTGWYNAEEDRYAGLQKNGESDDVTMGDSTGGLGMDEGGDLDEFLVTIHLNDEPGAPEFDYRPTQPIQPAAPVKPWSWSGRLTISPAGQSQRETVCEKATITDATEPAEPGKPKFGSFLLSTKDLNFTQFFETEDLISFIPICKPAQQFARLVEEGAGAESLSILFDYMSHKKEAALLPALWDDEVIGYLLFVPPAAKTFLVALGVPQVLCQTGGLIAVLLFLAPHTGRPCPRAFGHRPRGMVEREVLSPEVWRESMHSDPEYHLALHITRLPAAVRRYAFTHRSVVWSGSTPAATSATDTAHLRCALSKSRQGINIVDAADASVSVGMVFIHVGALSAVHALPHLAARRRQPEVRFYTYGTHPRIPPARWGHRPVFRLGGVVTFTPAALADDAWGVLCTIRQVHAHPLWVCYVLPQVLGLAVRLAQAREEGYAGGIPLALDRIFDAVLEGQVGLLRAPGGKDEEAPTKCAEHMGIGHHSDRRSTNPDSTAQWVLEHVWFRPLNKTALFARCEAACEAAYGDVFATSESNVVSLRKQWTADVCADVRRMQVQPAVADAYRRFVVLDLNSAGADADADIEWDTTVKFDFQDNFVTLS